jgi:hypothetical protein
VLTFFLPPLFKKTEDLARLKTTQATSSLQLFIPAGRLAAFVPGAPDASQWVGFSNR